MGGLGMMRARRYAQCHFVDIGALEQVMLREACCMSFYLKNIKSNRVKIKH